jgi:hypothetical protein
MNNTYLVYIRLFGISLMAVHFISCTNKLNVERDPNSISSRTTDPATPETTGSLEIGAKLYATNCAICHNPLTTSTKLGKSANDISNAIQTISSMTSLSGLSSDQISLIALALSGGPALTKGDPNAGVVVQVVMGNRYQLASQFKEMFVASSNPDANDTQIQALIDSLITSRPEGFGGNCTRNDPGCVANPCAGNGACKGRLNISQNAQVSPSASAIRKGYMIQMCEKVLTIDKAITNVSGKAGVDATKIPDSANVNKLMAYMYRQRSQDTSSTTKLLSLASTLTTNGQSTMEQWRFIMIALCQTSSIDLI